MGVAIINTYLVLLFLLVHFKIVRFNLFWKASPFVVLVLLLLGCAAGLGIRRAQCGVDRSRCRGRGGRCAGHRKHAAEGG
jgi:uncharacterized membrane protein